MNDKTSRMGVFSGFFPILVALGQTRGLSIQDMSAAAGISPLEIVDPHNRHSDESILALWNMIAGTDTEGTLTLSLATGAPMSIYGGLAEGARFADTLGAALEHLALNDVIIADRLSLNVDKSGDPVAIQLVHALDDVDEGHLSAVGIFLVKRLIVEVLGVPGAVSAVRLRLPRTSAFPKIQEFFECPVHMDQPANELHVNRAGWLKPINHANTELFAFVERHFCQARGSLEQPSWPDSLRGLREAIIENALRGSYDPKAIAETAQIGLRSAQRLAAQEGYTLQRLIDEVRFENAKALLGSPKLTVTSIAESLGFSDDRSFRRAFNRIVGVSPSEFRRNLGGRS
ncbi:MAG: helix-turn-helix domain-containing protein [Pseudomonadota bacterium]